MAWALERIAGAGFTPITVPAIAREQAFLNQGQFPGHQEETYELPNDDLWLAGTAEVVLTSLHSGEIIEADKLPILYAGYSPCFRREAGSAGKDVRGLLRVHQFVKVEQYVICEADDAQSAEWHARLLGLAEELLAGARNPLSGDRDLDRRHGPRQVSHERHRKLGAEPWQSIARRTAARRCTTGRRGGRTSATAARTARCGSRTRSTTPRSRRPRILVPLLENHQTADGRVRLPKALQELMGGEFL